MGCQNLPGEKYKPNGKIICFDARVVSHKTSIYFIVYCSFSKLKVVFALIQEGVQPEEASGCGGCQLLSKGWLMLEWVVGHLLATKSKWESKYTSAVEKDSLSNHSLWICPPPPSPVWLPSLPIVCVFIHQSLVTACKWLKRWPYCATLKSFFDLICRYVDISFGFI